MSIRKHFILIAIISIMLVTLTTSCNSPLFGLGGRVDTAVPGIKIETVDEGTGARALQNGDYVRGNIILRGTATDDIAVDTVTLQFQEGSSNNIIPGTVSGTTWTATIDTTQYIDGPKDFIVTVKDSAGKTTETRFVIYFDNRAPVVMFSLIVSEGDYSNTPLWGNITIKGSAADQFSIRKVRVYIYRKSDNTLVYASPDDASIGTNSFSLTLAPAAYGNLGNMAPEEAYFAVKAWDRSGNESTWFYLSSLITALDPRGLTIEDIMALENGTETEVNTIDLNELTSTRRYAPGLGFPDTQTVYYTCDQSANLPIVTITNPEQGKTASENTISKNAKASGVVQDANGVALIELKFRKETSPGVYVESAWYSDANIGIPGDDIDVSGNGQVVNWTSKTLYGNYLVNGSALDVGVYELCIRATDADNNPRTSNWVPFTIDADAPDISITTPTAGAYLTGDPVVISGEAHAYNTSKINTVEIYIDATNGWKPATTLVGAGTENATWTYNITQAMFPTDGLFTVKARVKDTPTNKEALFNIVITIDRTNPSGLSISSPSSGSSINGYKTFRGTANDNILLDKIYLVFEKNGEEILLDDTYSWSYSMDVNTLANNTYGYDMGNNIYRVPIRLKAVDKAGNITLTTSMGGNPNSPASGSYYIDADPDGDRPTITQVLSPGNYGNTYGSAYQIPGSIKVQGIASDDDAVHHVEMALMAIFDDSTEYYCQQLTGTPGSITLTTAPTWITIDGTSLWYKILNNNGELYDLSNATANPIDKHSGNFKIKLRAVDTKDNVNPDVTGNEVELYVRFDNTLPSVTGITPEENTVQRGTFTFQFTAQDNIQVNSAQISYNNGGTYTPISITPAASIPISLNIDTTTVNSGQFNNSAGTLNLRIKLTDDTNNISERNIKYLIDNIAPTAALTTNVTDLNNKMIDYTTNLANILGTANDTGAVKGVSKVEVWFERSGSQIFPASGHVIIDRNENYNDSAGDGDGYPESFTQNSGGWQWGFRFNSSLISDGDITVHYKVFDEAGNSYEYTAPGAIKNNKPHLSAIQLETDRNGDGDTTDDEERIRLERQTDINGEYTNTWKRFVLDAAGAKKDAGAVFDMATSALTVMNSRFTTRFEVASGNGVKYYCALAPNGTTELLSWDTTAFYTITNFGTGGWVENSNNTLSIQIRDSAVGTPFYTATQTFVVYVDNVDNTPPTASLNQLSATDVKDYDVNNKASWKGHIEPWNQSPWDNQDAGFNKTNDNFGNDADVSGTIIFSGTAWDDQRIQNFYMWIDLNGNSSVDASEEQLVAAYSSSVLVPQANTLGIWSATSQTLNASGHSVSWKFEWDSANVANVARSNVRVRVRVTDFGANNSSQLPSAPTDSTSLAGGFNIMKVDVVPYITEVTTLLNTLLGSDYNRSADGKYTVWIKSTGTASYETVTVKGFNLAPATLSGASSDIRISKDPDAYDATYTTKQGTGLPATIVTANTELTVTMQTTGSGYLTIIANNIPSLNNINSNDLSSNRPDSPLLQTALTDDRYFAVWDYNPLRLNASAPRAKNAVYPSMAMNGNTPQFAYVNNSEGYGLAEFWDGSTEIKIYENWDLFTFTSLALNSNNNRAALYDINVVQQGTDFIGDKGGIIVNLYYNPPNTTWNGTTYYYRDYNVWLDNLYKSGNLAVLDRYQYPNIKLVGTSALSHVFYSTYDSIDDRIIFRYFKTGTNQTSVGGGVPANATKVTDSATNLYVNNTEIVQRNENATWPTYVDNSGTNNTRFGQNNNSGNTNTGQYIATGTNVGIYSAVAGVSTGPSTARAVLIYYSGTTLYYMYATNDANTTWSSPVALDTNCGGAFVSAVVDKDNHVHIAYQDSFNGDVIYIYIPTYNDPATRKRVVVDSYLTVGEKLTLTVPSNSNTPYISYRGVGNTAKIAWYKGTPDVNTLTDGVTSSGKLNGNWEVQILPYRIIDSDTNRFNVGVGTNGLPVVGYCNNVPGAKGLEYLTALAELSN